MPHKSRHQSPQAECERIAARVRDALATLQNGCEGALAVIAEARQLLDAMGDSRPVVIPFVARFPHHASDEGGCAADPETLPCWDKSSGILSLGGLTVKRFRVPAENQAAILSAFEEEGWPRRIDDPLPPQAEIDSKYRLRFTIGRLNRSQRQSAIRFYGDGTGEGVCWELCGAVSTLGAAATQPIRRAA